MKVLLVILSYDIDNVITYRTHLPLLRLYPSYILLRLYPSYILLRLYPSYILLVFIVYVFSPGGQLPLHSGYAKRTPAVES